MTNMTNISTEISTETIDSSGDHYAEPGQWAVQWTSADGQACMWMGYGADAADALADAQNECAEQGIDDGELTAYLVVDEDDEE